MAAARLRRAVGMAALVLQESDAGSYLSFSDAKAAAFPPAKYALPPITTAAGAYRAVGMAALVLQELDAGSYSSF